MDFALLPPEINSGRMYTGPGAAPMLAAAAAWDALATELESAAVGCSAVLSSLIGHVWSGPAAAAMTTGAAPYVAWLQAASAKAEQTAMQANTVAAAYEAAFAATVPPATVAANRALLATLVATNFLGQNTPAIAATEAQYGEMWAQDAAAMYGYAAAAAPANALPSFDQPPQTANPGTSNTATAPTSGLSALTALVNPVTPYTSVAASGISFDSSMYTVSTNGAGWGRLLFVRGGSEGALTFEGLGPRGVLSASTTPVVGLGWGRATPIGELSVPPSWVSAAPELRPVAVSLAAAETELPAAAGLPPGTAFQEAMMGTTAGQGALPNTAGRRSQKTGAKNEDQDGQPVTALTNGSGWLASSWAYHNRRREGAPIPSHWRTG